MFSRNFLNETSSFNSGVCISKFGEKKIMNINENNLKWVGTFDKQYFKPVNIYSEPNEISKNNFLLKKNFSETQNKNIYKIPKKNISKLKKKKQRKINNLSEIHTKKNFYNKKKFYESSEKLLMKKTLKKSFKNPSIMNFSKIKKRGLNPKKINSKKENNFLFKIISKDELKKIFDDLDQKKMGLIGAKNLNFRKISANNLKILESLLLNFYNRPNLFYDFEDFIEQCKLYIKI